MRLVEQEIKGEVTIIRFNRPKAYNALTLEMIDQFVTALNEFEKSNSKVCIITGNGKAFCAGGDVKAMEKREDLFASNNEAGLIKLYEEGIQRVPRTMEKISKPLIAMVNGAAVGAGCDFACMCDLRYIGSDAFFKESFIKLALVSGDGGTFFLTRTIGYAKTMELVLTGRKVEAKEAKKIGMVHDVFPQAKLEKEVLKIAQALCGSSMNSLIDNKKTVRNAWRADLEDHLKTVVKLQAKTQLSEDHLNLVKKLLKR